MRREKLLAQNSGSRRKAKKKKRKCNPDWEAESSEVILFWMGRKERDMYLLGERMYQALG